MPPAVPPVVPVTAPAPSNVPHGWPLLRLGFRPFYIGGTLFAALTVPVWLAMFLGHGSMPLSLTPLLWHAHEMLFGFAAAIIVGFLLTAGKAWTGLQTLRGASLGALAGLWLAARLAALGAPYAWYAVLDLLLLPAVAAVLAGVLLRAGNRRGLPLAGLLLALSVANGVFHLGVLGVVEVAPMRALYAALALIVMIECVMTGRVIPAFSNNAIAGLKLKTPTPFDRPTLALTTLALLAWVFAAPAWLTAPALGIAAATHLQRQWRWKPWATRGRPILWILHGAYVWLAIGFALLALASLGWVATSAGVHALAVGATGGLIIGMVTRTARGHTGRPLQVSRSEVLAYAFILAAAVSRVLLPLVAPSWLVTWLLAAALAWSAAFVIYLVIYMPWLLSTRLDGKDG